VGFAAILGVTNPATLKVSFILHSQNPENLTSILVIVSVFNQQRKISYSLAKIKQVVERSSQIMS
jgi:hypothetical protein